MAEQIDWRQPELRKAKNIILLSDGTGNSAGKLHKTNVRRLYQALDLYPPDKTETAVQVAYYDDGVGSSSFKPVAVLGGAFGWGLKRNVLDLYKFLCRNYDDGDRIYVFGFSRGAFTARVLAGMVVARGLVRCRADHREAGRVPVPAMDQAELDRRAVDEFRRYRESRYKTHNPIVKLGRLVRNAFGVLVSGGRRTPSGDNIMPRIRFLGVWDTVAAYGLPFDELTRAWAAIFPLALPDRELSEKVDRACHAVALDDERNTFHPLLWNERNERNKADPSKPRLNDYGEERLTQIWFSGAHANVGGGYPDDSLAHVSLGWMMEQANAAGLSYVEDALQDVREAAYTDGPIYDSRAGVGGAYRYLPRKMAPLLHDRVGHNDEVLIEYPKIHHSVFDRLALGSAAYAPIVLPPSFEIVDANGEARPLAAAAAQIEQTRAARQEKAWNLVWARRIVYFTAVGVALLLASFPTLWPATAACDDPYCGVAWIIRLIGAVLPDFLKPWFAAYETHARLFATLLGSFVLLLWAGGRLRVGISDRMRRIWSTPDAPDPGLDGLARFRLSAAYLSTWRTIKYRILPSVVGLMALFVLVAGVSRAIFTVQDAHGWICAQHATSVQPFPTKRVCWLVKQNVEKDARYRITITRATPWTDNGIAAGFNGFGVDGMTWPMYGGVLYRRHMTERWFKLMARVGDTGTDEYTLQRDGLAPVDADTFVAEIVPRSSGPLYVYVNDAVTPIPKWQPFYANNTGTATVRVDHLPRDQQGR